MKYVVEFWDKNTGATSPIDTIDAPEGYTAADYIADCENNADDDWVDMLHNDGEVTLCPVTEE